MFHVCDVFSKCAQLCLHVFKQLHFYSELHLRSQGVNIAVDLVNDRKQH